MATTVKFPEIDVNDFLSKKQAAEPDLAADWARLEELYNKKLWHQLTLKLEQFVTHSALQTGDSLIQLYNNFLCIFENKINPLSLVEIAAHISNQYSDKRQAVAFLESIEKKVKINDEAVALAKVLQGQIYLEQLNELEPCARIIGELEESLRDDVTSVHPRLYRLAADYYRVRGPMSRYYRSALRYVGCGGGGAQLPPAERRQLALRLALAAVLAPDVYSLAELLEHPIMSSLAGTADAWAVELVAAVAKGSQAEFEEVRARANVPELHRADRQLRQKVAILCLMEMAFNRSSSGRKLSFAEIAAAARVPHDEVELLVMKALAEQLLRGHIDQVTTRDTRATHTRHTQHAAARRGRAARHEGAGRAAAARTHRPGVGDGVGVVGGRARAAPRRRGRAGRPARRLETRRRQGRAAARGPRPGGAHTLTHAHTHTHYTH